MATSNFQSNKTRKSKPKLFGFQSFASPESMMNFSAPFRENIRMFLYEYGELEDYSVDDKPIWCTWLESENNGIIFPLYTIEETVKYTSSTFCEYCRCVGWGNHFVSKRRYHLIIPDVDHWNKHLEKDTLELSTHILEAVIHCNGLGHLLCVNGLTDGTVSISADEVMNLFDRICTSLQARKITVRDTSKKESMELRLLNSVAYGQPWFGKWGYNFCNGTFGITKEEYQNAIEVLTSFKLDKIISDFAAKGEGVHKIIWCYRGASETQLVTISELLQFMLSFKFNTPIEGKSSTISTAVSSNPSARTTHQQKTPMQDNSRKYETFVSSIAKLESRWPARRLEHAAKVIVDVLKENRERGKFGMVRQELRDEARLHIGDTGLIDFVLKSIGTSVRGNQIVCRSPNHVTGLSEFTLTDLANVSEFKKGKTEVPPLFSEPGLDVYKDIMYLYKEVLLGYTKSDSVALATQIVLDSKHFVKEWVFNNEDGDTSIRLICRVMPSYEELVSELTRQLAPGELVIVPPGTTIGELKLLAQSALRDTYCIMDQFIVKQIGGGKGREDEEVLAYTGELDAQVWVRGSGLDLDTKLRYEGGPCDWTVACVCGAKDDDGERMVACDECHVWQHTRCNGIDDDADAPRRYLCHECSLK